MSIDARLDRIPNYVTAKSPQGLRRLMLANNIKYSQPLNYHSIQFVNGAWFAWFHVEQSSLKAIKAQKT